MKHIHTKYISCKLILLLCAALLSTFSGTIYAISPEQIDVFNKNIRYFNVETCGQSASSNDTSNSGTNASYPNLDAEGMANSIETFIGKKNPDSRLKGTGTTIVASAKNSNVNPFLIVAIAMKESGLANKDDYNVKTGNNSFGRTASAGQPSFNGSRDWYKWGSVKASVDYLAPENKGVSGGGDMASYLRATYADSINSGNILALLTQYAPPAENDTDTYNQQVNSWIADMVDGAGAATPANDTQSSATSSCACVRSSPADGESTGGVPTLTGKDNRAKIYNYLRSQGLSVIQAAAIVGNFGQESSWNPQSVQGGGPGRGIAQWSVGDRWDTNPNGNVKKFAEDNNGDINDLATQVAFVWYELNHSFKPVLTKLKAMTDITQATTLISTDYEIAGIPNIQSRIDKANAAKNDLGGSAADGSSSVSGCSAPVNCTGSLEDTGTVSTLRQNVVCLARQELAAWDGGSMKAGFRSGAEDSYAKYSQNTNQEWCADFVSWLYKQSGYPIGSGNNWRVPAVDGIQSIGQQNDKFHYHDASGYTPKPGDIVIHKNGGSHVNVVESVDGSTVKMIGGNQSPNSEGYPNGSRVSEYTIEGFSSGTISGYVSPD